MQTQTPLSQPDIILNSAVRAHIKRFDSSKESGRFEVTLHSQYFLGSLTSKFHVMEQGKKNPVGVVDNAEHMLVYAEDMDQAQEQLLLWLMRKFPPDTSAH